MSRFTSISFLVKCSQSYGVPRRIFLQGFEQDGQPAVYNKCNGCEDSNGSNECKRCRELAWRYANGMDSSDVELGELVFIR